MVQMHVRAYNHTLILNSSSWEIYIQIQGFTWKFLDWLPGARTANGTTLCH
jgi:hypothetical protein